MFAMGRCGHSANVRNGSKAEISVSTSNGASGAKARSIASGDHLPDSYYIVLAIARARYNMSDLPVPPRGPFP